MKIASNGIQLNYEIEGPEGAPTVTMSHSLAATLEMWNPQMSILGDYRVVRYDKRGHGGSDAPEIDYSFDMLADDLLGLLDGLGIEKTHYIGLSMGGMIGQTAALKDQSRFHSLVLADTSSQVPAAMAGAWDERVENARAGGMEPLVEPTMERWFSADFMACDPKSSDSVRDMIRNTPVAGYCGCCRAIQGLDLTDKISAIEVPTLVICGEDDPGTPVEAHEVIHNEIAGSELVILKDALHFANMEQAGGFNDAYGAFLAKHS